MMKRLLYALTISLLTFFTANAQITTSGLSGFVKSASNEPLVGATVTATHQPTGTVYRTQTKAEGKYELSNMNPGGPYSVTITYVNYQAKKRDSVYLTLGESAKQDFELTNTSTQLTEVVVTANRTTAPARGGTETNIGRDRLANLPTVSRNITDFLRVVPQAKIT